MVKLHLIVGNKNYSSWSMRPWLALRACDVPFSEATIWLDTATAQREKLAHSPAGRVPILEVDGFTIWDSLAICEFVAETFPSHGLWPDDVKARARARSLCAEMHSGFQSLRTDLPLNCRARKPAKARRPDTQRDIDRVTQLLTDTREEFGGAGDFLFGRFSIADAYFAPVASRFVTYSAPVTGTAKRWCDAVLGHAAAREWLDGAQNEGHALPATDAREG